MINKFKIHPDKTRYKYYYEVIIFENYNEMYKYYKETGGYQELDFVAVCRDLEIYKGKIPQNKIGEILIPRYKCKQGIITHECGHATFQFLRKVMKEDTWQIDKESLHWGCEESYCKILGDLTKQFTNELYKNNLM